MLKYTDTFGSFSADNLEKAKQFYGEMLGLDVHNDPMGGLELKLSATQRVYIYHKPDHVAAGFTVLNFMVTDIDETVEALAKKGIVFEQYRFEFGGTDSKGIMRHEKQDIAWFRDPAGNFLSVIRPK